MLSVIRIAQPRTNFRRSAFGRGQKTEDRGQKSEGGGRRVEGGGQRAKGRGQRAEGKGQGAKGRGQRAEGGGQRTETGYQHSATVIGIQHAVSGIRHSVSRSQMTRLSSPSYAAASRGQRAWGMEPGAQGIAHSGSGKFQVNIKIGLTPIPLYLKPYTLNLTSFFCRIP